MLGLIQCEGRTLQRGNHLVKVLGRVHRGEHLVAFLNQRVHALDKTCQPARYLIGSRSKFLHRSFHAAKERQRARSLGFELGQDFTQLVLRLSGGERRRTHRGHGLAEVLEAGVELGEFCGQVLHHFPLPKLGKRPGGLLRRQAEFLHRCYGLRGIRCDTRIGRSHLRKPARDGLQSWGCTLGFLEHVKDRVARMGAFRFVLRLDDKLLSLPSKPLQGLQHSGHPA